MWFRCLIYHVRKCLCLISFLRYLTAFQATLSRWNVWTRCDANNFLANMKPIDLFIYQKCVERTWFLCLLTGLHSQPTLCNTCSSCVRVCGTSVDLLVCGLGHHTDDALLDQVLDCGTSQASVDLYAAKQNSVTVKSSNEP